jgi:hypothetical protein
VLYSKPGCHLCEGLAEKLRQIPDIPQLQMRDITTQADWWDRYQFEIPVLCWVHDQQEWVIPRLSPRASVDQIRTQLRRSFEQLGIHPAS